MALEFLRQYLDQILIGAGGSVVGLLALVAGWKKFAKSTPKGARKRLKYLIKFMKRANNNLEMSISSYTLSQVANSIDSEELKWENDK